MAGIEVVAEFLRRGVQEFGGQHQQQARDERDPDPRSRRDHEGQRHAEGEECQFLSYGALGPGAVEQPA